MKVGMLMGPTDFFESRESITFSISSGKVGDRKKELLGIRKGLSLTSLLVR